MLESGTDSLLITEVLEKNCQKKTGFTVSDDMLSVEMQKWRERKRGGGEQHCREVEIVNL